MVPKLSSDNLVSRIVIVRLRVFIVPGAFIIAIETKEIFRR